jgi:sulfur carrier protein
MTDGATGEVAGITVWLNGEERQLAGACRLDQAIAQWSPAGGFAVAVNEQFVPRGGYAEIALKAGDRIEILVPMQGG